MIQDHFHPILLLYYRPNCPFCIKVTNYLKESGINIPLKNITNDPQGREELSILGGKTQVPCLFINGKPMYESNDIINWIKTNMAH